jgi:hypothetical protein
MRQRARSASHTLDAFPPGDSDLHAPGLAHIVDQLAHLLPAQGPISIFIHHNTLHAFEDLPFESAVERAAGRFGCQPFLSEERYRAKVAAGRIRARDVESLLAEELGPGSAEDVAGVGTRFDLWRRIVLHGIPIATGRATPARAGASSTRSPPSSPGRTQPSRSRSP